MRPRFLASSSMGKATTWVLLNGLEAVFSETLLHNLAIAFNDRHREGMKEVMKVVEEQREKVKHTSHADGLGMGSQCCETHLKDILEKVK